MWKSLYFAWTYQIGRESSSTDLAELQKQNPTDPTPTVMLAGSYRYFQQYEKAADAYAQASQIATEDDSRRFRIRSAECLRSAKRLADARSQLERLLGITELPLTTRIEALKELYSVLKDSFEVEYAFAVGELILFDNPGDIDFRFTIGYDYLNHHPSMAVYHYELVCEKEPDSVALNNLGYAYKETDFPIYAARKYREAANLKEARAFRNLALNYVNSGFADDALALLASAEEANAPDPEGLIAQATATVYEQISGERDRHQQAMESTRSYRGFLPRMGKALFESFDFVIDGNWVFPAGQVTLIHTKGQVHGTGEEGYRLTNWGLRALAGASPGKGKKTFTFAGQVTGRVCQFIMTATIVHDDPLTFDPTEEPVHGYVIFDGDGEHAEVSEYKDEKPTSFYTISKAS
jgi:hypothetical protein